MKQIHHVLIVEDSPDDFRIYSHLLQRIETCKYSYELAESGGHALDQLKQKHFDCILLDYGLPDMDGLTLLKKIRADLPTVPIVMLTGRSRDEIATAARDIGVSDYIDKSDISGNRLHDAIVSAIGQFEAVEKSAQTVPLSFLLIDDSPDDRETYVRLLRQTRYRSARFVQASSGAEALQYLGSETIHAILLDYLIPGMDGLEVLKRVREIDPWVPVILLAGAGNVTVAVAALRAGANDYLVKSLVDADLLYDTLNTTIQKSTIAARDAKIMAMTDELQARDERFRVLLQSQITEALYLLDPEGNVETWNASAERIKGYTAAEIIGRNFEVFFTPEDRASGEPARVLAAAREHGRFKTEAWRQRKDGSRFLASASVEAIRRPDGVLRGFVKVTHDITQSRIEEEQRSIIIEATPNGILIVDEAGRIALTNSRLEAIFRYPRGSLVGKQIETLLPSASTLLHPAFRTAGSHVPDSKATALDLRVKGICRDGSEVPLEIGVRPVETPRGGIVVATVVDVTERLQREADEHAAEAREREIIQASNDRLERLSRHLAKARDRAEQANMAKSRFLAGITHELRTPLNGILGYAQLLHLEGGLSPAQSKRVDTMLECGRHLLGMINAVLDLAQIEAGRLELKAIDIDLPRLARSSMDLVAPSAKAKGLVMSLAPIPDGLPRLLADPTRLQQVLVNLLGNAVKFTPSGVVGLGFRFISDTNKVRMEVRDTGPGVGVTQQAHLFKEFHRFDTPEAAATEGAGLGLAITARLVHEMGGEIGYEDNPAGGSLFWVEMPAMPEADLPDPVSASPSLVETEAAAEPNTGLRVLVVDDIAINREVAGNFLQHAGHTAVFANNGNAAVALATTSDFDLILMDLLMPGIDGLEATRQIRALPPPRGLVPIVALSAQAFEGQVKQCFQVGMSGHISKPFEHANLIAVVERLAAVPWREQSAAPAPSPASWPAAAGPDDDMLFDRTAMVSTSAMVAATDKARHFEVLIARAAALLDDLRAIPTADQLPELSAAAHVVGGAAGMFGFKRLANAAQRFEAGVEQNSADIEGARDALAAAIADTIDVIDREVRAVPGAQGRT